MPSVEVATPRIPDTSFDALQGELAMFASGIRALQGRLRQVALAAHNRTRHLQIKVEELEAQNLARALEICELEAQNAELHHAIQARSPDLANAIEARDDAVKNLDHAHKVIEDLLKQRKTEAADSPDTDNLMEIDSISSIAHNLHRTVRSVPSAQTRGTTHNPRIESISSVPCRTIQLTPVSIESASASVWSDDESTVRSPQLDSVTPSTVTAPDPPPLRATAVRQQQEPLSPEFSGPNPTERFSSRGNSYASKGKKPATWYLELARTPATAELVEGVFSFKHLSENLTLEEDTIIDIGNMECKPGFDINMYTEGEVAFVYRPVILEGPKETYLIGWGDESTVASTQDWFGQPKRMHVFVWPASESSGWFYIGLHTLSYAPLDLVWDKIDKESKTKLLIEFKERNPGIDVMKRFKRDVKAGKLVQCCLQLEGKGKKAESHDFIREYGLLNGDARIADI